MNTGACVFVIVSIALLSGCERAMHDMYSQPKKNPGSGSAFYGDGSASRLPPYGSVVASMGPLAGTTSGRVGHAEPVDAPLAQTQSNPLPITMALLQRGRQRYDIYCAACHGLTGQGDGMVVQRGFPAPESFTSPRLLQSPDGYFEEAMRRGYGVMYPFADRVNIEDRWAITAYIRALQLSQHAQASQLSPSDQQALAAKQAPERR